MQNNKTVYIFGDDETGIMGVYPPERVPEDSFDVLEWNVTIHFQFYRRLNFKCSRFHKRRFMWH